MSAIAEAFPHQAVDVNNDDPGHLLALVQGDLVISTFPEDQTDAAIDLARVLCRALTQPVDLFRVRQSEFERVQSGAIPHTAGPGWTHLAHLHITFPLGVAIDVRDPAMREKLAGQLLAP